MCMCVIRRKMADRMYGHPRHGVLNHRNRAISEKMPQIFQPSLHTEYVTASSQQTDTPEVRCDLTDTRL